MAIYLLALRPPASDQSPSMVNRKGQEASAAICCFLLLCLLSHSFTHLTRCKPVQPADDVDDVLHVSFPQILMRVSVRSCGTYKLQTATNSNKQHNTVKKKKTVSNCPYICGLLNNHPLYTGWMQRCLHINKPMYISVHAAISFLLKGQRD